LNRYRSDSTYSDFLQKYTPVNDPFLHEARVHLFWRDRYIREAEAEKENEEIYHDRIMVAYRENLIMKKYLKILQTLEFCFSARATGLS